MATQKDPAAQNDPLKSVSEKDLKKAVSAVDMQSSAKQVDISKTVKEAGANAEGNTDVVKKKRKRRKKPAKTTTETTTTMTKEEKKEKPVHKTDTPKEEKKEKTAPKAPENTPEEPKPNVNIKSDGNMLPGIDDIQAYIQQKKIAPTKTVSPETGVTSKDGVDLLTLPNLFAVVPHAKGSHKLVYLADQAPKDLVADPKGRKKGGIYTKNGMNIYTVQLDMYEHPTLKTIQDQPVDVRVVNTPAELDAQLAAIHQGQGGGDNFGLPILAPTTQPKTSEKPKAKEKVTTPKKPKEEKTAPEAIVEPIPEPVVAPIVPPVEPEPTPAPELMQELPEEPMPQPAPEIMPEPTPTPTEPIVESIPEPVVAPVEPAPVQEIAQEVIPPTPPAPVEPVVEEPVAPIAQPEPMPPEAVEPTPTPVEPTPAPVEPVVAATVDDLMNQPSPFERMKEATPEPVPTQATQEEPVAPSGMFRAHDATEEKPTTPPTEPMVTEATTSRFRSPDEIVSSPVSEPTPISTESTVELTPVAPTIAEAAETESVLNLDTLGTEEEAPTTTESTAPMPTLNENDTMTNTAASSLSEKPHKKFSFGRIVRGIFVVIVATGLRYIRATMFPTIQGEKPTDETQPTDTLLTGQLQTGANELLPTDEVPSSGTDTATTPTDTTNPTTDTSTPNTMTLAELQTKLENQQIEARKILNIAKLLENKSAIKFSMAAMLKAGNVLERIKNEPTISADEVSMESTRIDRYIQEANKLVE